MKKQHKKQMVKELKLMSGKDKIKIILHLMGQIEMMRTANNMQFEILSSLFDAKTAKATKSMQ